MTASEKSQFQKLMADVAELMKYRENDRRIYQQDIAPKEVKQRHIDGIIVFKGVAADLPSDGSTQIQAYWATDTGVLYIWDGAAWLSTTLS